MWQQQLLFQQANKTITSILFQIKKKIARPGNTRKGRRTHTACPSSSDSSYMKQHTGMGNCIDLSRLYIFYEAFGSSVIALIGHLTPLFNIYGACKTHRWIVARHIVVNKHPNLMSCILVYVYSLSEAISPPTQHRAFISNIYCHSRSPTRECVFVASLAQGRGRWEEVQNHIFWWGKSGQFLFSQIKAWESAKEEKLCVLCLDSKKRAFQDKEMFPSSFCKQQNFNYILNILYFLPPKKTSRRGDNQDSRKSYCI